MKKTLLTSIASLLVATTFAQRTVYVDIDATGVENGTSWATAYNEPQDAFANANIGDNIWIAEGTYILQTTLRNYSFGWNKDSVSVYGGFDGTETALSQRDVENNPTIFSGEIQGDNDLTNNSYTVLAGPYGSSLSNKINYSLIDGITIKDGFCISNTTNFATRWGAGFYLQSYVRNLTINNCTFTNNTAQGGAAMYVSADADSSDVFVTNTKFIDNRSSFANCIWGKSTAGNPLNFRIINCLFAENTNFNFGGVQNGGVFYFHSDGHYANLVVSILNSTITQNTDNVSSASNGQIIMFNKTNYSQSTATLEVGNSIFYNNTGFFNTTKKYIPASYYFTSTVFINCISNINSYAANTNKVNIYGHDPLFTNPSSGDFTLQSTSPAIDSGKVLPGLMPTYDLVGNARIKGTSVDLGCYEFQTEYVGVIENKEFASLNLFPNPTTGYVTFESKEEIESIEIFSLTGQVVKSFYNTKRIDISEMTPGIYMARVISGNKISTKRLIKQ